MSAGCKDGNANAMDSRPQTSQPRKVSQVVPCQLRLFMRKFHLSDTTKKDIYTLFMCQISKGLSKSKHDSADIKCLISYVHNLPTGSEVGKFLALDLGGSNFRVILVTLDGPENEPDMKNKVFQIPQSVMTGPGVKLFDYVANCVKELLTEENLLNERLPLGFTFSFPCVQKNLKEAILIKWTKGFDCEGVVDHEVGQMLIDAMERQNVKIDLVAIVNDTVGTLMTCAHRNPECRIGLIVGTGCNACYVEKSENCELLEPQLKKKYKETIINCEWGAFGENGDLDFIRTDYDKQIDIKSLNTGGQIFEKMISGMYLGEITRLALKEAVQNGLIFTDCNKQALLGILNTENSFQTQHISTVENDKYPCYKNTERVIQEVLQIPNPSQDDCYKLLYMCSCVGRRSATLVGIGLAALINKICSKTTTIGVDGTLYKKHPKYECYIYRTMKKLVDESLEYKMVLSEDGSGLGASIIAAVHKPDKNNADNRC